MHIFFYTSLGDSFIYHENVRDRSIIEKNFSLSQFEFEAVFFYSLIIDSLR